MSIRPDYYTQNGLEAFDVIKAFFMDKAFLSHAFKYMARAGRKGDEREDIRKAITYLEAHLETLEPKPAIRNVVDYMVLTETIDDPESEAWEEFFKSQRFRKPRLDAENAYEEETAYLTGGK